MLVTLLAVAVELYLIRRMLSKARYDASRATSAVSRMLSKARYDASRATSAVSGNTRTDSVKALGRGA